MTLLIALISLTVSVTVGWFSAVKPADITVTASDIRFGSQADGELVIVGTCSFANNGARAGSIDMVALRFESQDDDTNWLYEPKYVVDDARLLAADRSGLMKAEFAAVVLPGKQTATYTYVFVTTQKVTLAPHKFRVTLYSSSPSDKQVVEQQVRTIDFNAEVIFVLQRSNGFVGVPFEETRHQMQSLANKSR